MEKFKRIVKLIEKTGDKCIVFDPKNDDTYVIMGLNDYERMALNKNEVSDLTEEQLLDKINRDIAVWKASQENDKEIDIPPLSEQKEAPSEPVQEEGAAVYDKITEEEEEKEPDPGDDKYYFEPLE